MNPAGMFQLLDRLRDRLVTVHGLTSEDAIQAIAEHHQREDSPHRDLVEREADALIRELAVSGVRDLVVDLTPIVRDVTAALNDFFDTLRAQLQGITAARAAVSSRRDRPAWASPYGPPSRRRKQ